MLVDTTGISAFPFGWPWEAQSSPRVARVLEWGAIAFSKLSASQTLRPLLRA